jgi:hypothetical protein
MRWPGTDSDVEDDLDDDTVWRLLVWAGFAAVALGGAVLAAQSERGADRLARLFPLEVVAAIPPAPETKPIAAPGAAEPQLATKAEKRADSGANSPQTSTPVAGASQDITGSSQRTGARGAPAERLPDRPGDLALPNAPEAAGAGAAPQRVVESFAAFAASRAADSVVTSTEFGVDVGSEKTVEGLRALWMSLREHHGPLFAALRPVIAVREAKSTGLELRLVVGPLTDAAAAARLCSALGGAGVPCEPTVFDGQRLAVR